MFLNKTKSPENNSLIYSNIIKESADVELLSLIIHNKLSFEKYIARLYLRASHKLHALEQIRKYFTLENTRFFRNAFMDSQLNYAYLI